MTAQHVAGLIWSALCIAAVALIYRDWWEKRQQEWADVERCRQLGRALTRQQTDDLTDDLMALADAVQAPTAEERVRLIAAADVALWELELGAEA